MKPIIHAHLLRRPRYHRLIQTTHPKKLPDSAQAFLEALYSGTNTDFLVAAVLNAAITQKKPVFLLSRNDLEYLASLHSKYEQPYSRAISLKEGRTLTEAGKKRGNLYRGVLALLTQEAGWAKALNSPSAGSKEPLVIELTDPLLLELAGNPEDALRQAALFAASACRQSGVKESRG